MKRTHALTLVLALTACGSSPVSVNEGLLSHEELNFSVTLSKKLKDSGWTIEVDKGVSRHRASYSFDILPPRDGEILAPVHVTAHDRNRIPNVPDSKIYVSSFEQGRRDQAVVQILQVESINVAGYPGHQGQFLRVHTVDPRSIDLVFAAQVDGDQTIVRFEVTHATPLSAVEEPDGNDRLAMSETAFTKLIPAYEDIVSTVRF